MDPSMSDMGTVTATVVIILIINSKHGIRTRAATHMHFLDKPRTHKHPTKLLHFGIPTFSRPI